MKIKVCGMKHSGNILELAALKPDYMGFIFYDKSKRYVSALPSEILSLPKEIHKTGVFVNEDIHTIVSTAEKYRLDTIQLHGNEIPEICDQLKRKGYSIIKAINIGNIIDLEKVEDYLNFCGYFLFDTKTTDKYGGSGKKFNWEILSHYKEKIPFFLSGGIHISDITEILSFKHPAFYGIDINSCFEMEPGLKNIPLIKEFIFKLRNKDIDK